MTYSIIETISIIFIVLGVLLAISAVVTFYTKIWLKCMTHY